MQMITPNLWFDDQAEEAAKFYTSIFKNAKIGRITRYGKEGVEAHGKPEGSIMTVEFQIEGQNFVALNGGPQFKSTKLSHWKSIAKRRKKSIIIGKNFRKASIPARSSADGLKINMASPGRSFRPY